MLSKTKSASANNPTAPMITRAVITCLVVLAICSNPSFFILLLFAFYLRIVIRHSCMFFSDDAVGSILGIILADIHDSTRADYQ